MLICFHGHGSYLCPCETLSLDLCLERRSGMGLSVAAVSVEFKEQPLGRGTLPCVACGTPQLQTCGPSQVELH